MDESTHMLCTPLNLIIQDYIKLIHSWMKSRSVMRLYNTSIKVARSLTEEFSFRKHNKVGAINKAVILLKPFKAATWEMSGDHYLTVSKAHS